MTRAIILAAGRGSRMGELTEDQPKCFARLHGRRLLDLQLAALGGAGMEQLAIVRGYRADSFTEPVTYFDNPRWAESNMVRTLLCADPWLSAEDCIISYSDIFYGAATVTHLAATAGDLAISYDPAWLDLWAQRFADPLDDAESFKLTPEGNLQAIGERCGGLDEIAGQYMGLLKSTPAGWKNIQHLLSTLSPAAVDRLDMTGLLRAGLQAGWHIGVSTVQDPWGEVDAPNDLALYERLFAANQLSAEPLETHMISRPSRARSTPEPA